MVVLVAAAVVTGAVVAAPTPARPPPPGSLMAPRQASGAAVALAEAEGHLHMSPQYQQLHPHTYPPAQHRAEHRRIRTQIRCFSPSVLRVRVHFQLRVFDQKRSRLRISNCILHAGTIDFWP